MAVGGQGERNLLFGLFALQNDFIDCRQLTEALAAWADDRSRSLADLLCERAALTPVQADVLNRLLDLHVVAHGSEEASLASRGLADSIDRALTSITDPQLRALCGKGEPSEPTPSKTPALGDNTLAWPKGQLPGMAGARFRYLRSHARGGLGEVYLAEDLELHREVALKEIQSRHANDSNSRQRFLLEAEVTGNLEHPGVVPVYALGAHDDGRPFYAMRFIKGDSLKEAAEAFHRGGADFRSVDFRRLLGRFVDICNVVAYAHSRGVLHRDLKPGNIMLGKYGETLVVDWGLAKLVGSDSAPLRAERSTDGLETPVRTSSGSAVEPTYAGSALGTPPYMSPEQARGDLAQLGAATDVYSLGATLYFVLTGLPPFQQRTVAEILAAVQQGAYERARACNPAVPPALDAICAKAMAHAPAERPASALELAAEIERWLADEPVAAYREPLLPRMLRWARRHSSLVAGAGAAMVVCAVGATLGLWHVSHTNRQLTELNRQLETQRAVAQQERARAEEQSAVAVAVREFLQDDLLRQMDSRAQALRKEPVNPNLTVREALERAAATVGARFADRPLVEAGVRAAIADGYLGIELGEPSRIQAEKALELYRSRLGPTAPETLDAMNRLATARQVAGQLRSALELFQQTYDAKRARLGAGHPDTLVGANNLAAAMRDMGMATDAQALLGEAIARSQEVFGADAAATLTAQSNLAQAMLAAGKAAEAAQLQAEVLQRREAQFGKECPDALIEATNLSEMELAAGQVERALQRAANVLDVKRRIFGERHPSTISSLHGLGHATVAAGKLGDGAALLERAVAQSTAALGETHPATLAAQADLANTKARLGQFDQSIRDLEKVRSRLAAALGPQHPDTLMIEGNLATVMMYAGKIDAAIALHRTNREARRNVLGVDHPDALESSHNLALALLNAGRIDESIATFEPAVAAMNQRMGASHPQTLASRGMLALAYKTAKRYDEAIANYRQTISAAEKHLGPNHETTLMATSNLAVAYRATGRAVDAVAIYRSVLPRLVAHYGATHPTVLSCRSAFASTLTSAGQCEEAVALLRELVKLENRVRPDHWETFYDRCKLGSVLVDCKKYSEAERELLAGYEGLVRRLAQIPPRVRKDRLESAIDAAIALYEQSGRPAEAKAWQSRKSSQSAP